MGTGKSRAAIVAWERLGRPKTIIVAPLSVVRGVWPDQFERWAIHPMPNIGIIDSRIGAGRGKSAVQNRIEVARTSDVAIINYDLIWRKPLSEAILKMGFELLIMDESHRIKAAGGVTSRYMSRLSDRVPKRIALTGTPMPHSPMDLYAQFRAIDKRIFGTSNALFKARYGILGGFSGREVVGYQREDELRDRFASISVSVNADDVLTLPDSVDSTRMFELSPKGLKLYKQAETQFLIELEQGVITVAKRTGQVAPSAADHERVSETRGIGRAGNRRRRQAVGARRHPYRLRRIPYRRVLQVRSRLEFDPRRCG